MAAPNELSFLPDDYLERKAQRRTNLICALLFLAVAGSVGAAFALGEKGRRELQGQQRAIERQYTDAARPLEQFRQMQEKQKKMARQAELSASLLEKVPRSFILAEVTNSMPAQLALTDFTLASKVRTAAASAATPKTAYEASKAARQARNSSASTEPPSNEPKAYDVSMKLQGVASTDVQVAQFISRLSRSRFFREVNLVYSEELVTNEQKMRKFQIDMTLDPEVEVKPDDLKESASIATELESR